jgi:hypothetical protein
VSVFALALAIISGPGVSDVPREEHHAALRARSAIQEARIATAEAAARTCGLEHRRREVEQLEDEHDRLVGAPSAPVKAVDGAVVIYGNQRVSWGDQALCKRSSSYREYVIVARAAQARARNALGLGE